MWDPNTGMGTVTHQNIGYLWPMGPWYRVFAAAGMPVWVAQRLWTGTLLLAAGLGVRWLLRTLGWAGPGRGRGQPGLHAQPVRRPVRGADLGDPHARGPPCPGCWPWPSGRCAEVAGATRPCSPWWPRPSGSVNATGLIYAGLAPVLWFPFAVWGLGTTTVRRAAVAMAKIGAPDAAAVAVVDRRASLIEGRYGLNILRYTETVEVVARTGLPFEALRGLGNWFFYGRDAVGPWVQPAQDYTKWAWLLGRQLRRARRWPSPPPSWCAGATSCTSPALIAGRRGLRRRRPSLRPPVAARVGVQGVRHRLDRWAWPCAAPAGRCRWSPWAPPCCSAPGIDAAWRSRGGGRA